jgi:hypothetical protein
MKASLRSQSRISGAASAKQNGVPRATAALAEAAAQKANGRLDAGVLRKMGAWWRPANYLSVGQTDLLTWFSAITPCQPRLVLTHGEDEPRQILARKIQQRFKVKSALPGMGETIEL